MAHISIDTDFIYYGLFLPQEEQNYLLSMINENNFWSEKLENATQVICSHITLIHIAHLNLKDLYNSIDDNLKQMILNIESFKSLDIPITLTIDGIGYSDKAMAFRIRPNNFIQNCCCNKQPHLTICVFNGGKPVDSNRITNWFKIQPITIETKIKKIIRNKK